MSSITRKNKRRAAFKCAKQGIAPAQAIAVSAAREIKVTKEAAAETMEVLLQAIALVAAHDYGKLNAKDTRLGDAGAQKEALELKVEIWAVLNGINKLLEHLDKVQDGKRGAGVCKALASALTQSQNQITKRLAKFEQEA